MISRTIDTRRAKNLDPKKYKAMKWAPGHTKTVGGAFSAGDQVARVLQIEKQKPTLLPLGFRAEVAARPRDASLRLRMARCELQRVETRRRASYDAALALLFGAPAKEVEPVLMEATRNQGANNNSSSSCFDGTCAKGLVCLGDECVTPMGVGVVFASKEEIDIEDAITRALMPLYEERHGDDYAANDAIYWWLDRRLHHCGKFRCLFSAYEVKGKTRVVEWDQRDGGTVETIPFSKWTPDEKKRYYQRLKCWNATGTQLKSYCLQMCDINRRGEECRFRCYQNCAL